MTTIRPAYLTILAWAKAIHGSVVGAFDRLTASGRLAPANQAGEGVISTGIAVLIMAALGALMWAGFQDLWQSASTQTADQISQIGR